jgi:membrane protein DedA with SNARE-associated domain
MLDRILAVGSLPLVLMGLVVAGIGLPVPEDPMLLSAGVIAHRTTMGWELVLPLVYAAAIGADCGLFLMARRLGEPLLQRAPFRWLVRDNARQRVIVLFQRHGSQAIFFGRHMPGLRALVFVFAGVGQVAFTRFVLWDGLAGLVTIPAVFFLGYFFSVHVDAVRAGVARAEHWIALGCALSAGAAWLLWSRRQPKGAGELDDGSGDTDNNRSDPGA